LNARMWIQAESTHDLKFYPMLVCGGYKIDAVIRRNGRKSEEKVERN